MEKQQKHTVACSKCSSRIERTETTDLFDNHDTLICQFCVNYRDNPEEFVKAVKEALNALKLIDIKSDTKSLLLATGDLKIGDEFDTKSDVVLSIADIRVILSAITRADAAFGGKKT